MRKRIATLWLIGAVGAVNWVSAVCGAEIISEPAALRHGLTRAWTAQVQVDAARGRVDSMVLDGGTLFVQTNQAVLEAIDAETGKRLWSREVGERGHPSMAPAMNARLVVVVNGSSLYVVNRYNGKLLLKIPLPAAPGAGPALSQQRAYVPMVNGTVVSYRLKPTADSLKEFGKPVKEGEVAPEERAAKEVADRESLRLEDPPPPLTCPSPGRILVPPLVTRQTADEEYVAWTTDRGYVCVGRIKRVHEEGFPIVYRLETNGPLTNQPCYVPPDANVQDDSGVIFAAAEDGFVHAIRERDGRHLWRFSTGNPIVESPVLVGHFLFVTNQLGGMYCLDAKNGAQLWWTPEVTRFVAVSKQRLYAADPVGRVRVLNAQSGGLLDTLGTEPFPLKFANAETDRIFLASKTGQVHCLHEVELSQPLVRRVLPKEEEPEPTKGGPAKVAAAEQPPEDQPEAGKPAAPRPAASSSRPSTPRASSTKASSKKSDKSGKTGRGAAGSAMGPMGGDGGTPDRGSGRRGTGRRGGGRAGSGGAMPGNQGMPMMPMGPGGGRGAGADR